MEMVGPYPAAAAAALRQRRRPASPPNPTEAEARPRPAPLETPPASNLNTNNEHVVLPPSSFRTSHLYCFISFLVALLAIITSSPAPSSTSNGTAAIGTEISTNLLKNAYSHSPLTTHTPTSTPLPFLLRLVDPALVPPTSTTLPTLLDKILTSTPRLLSIANLLLSITYLLHSYIANLFLSPSILEDTHHATTSRERLGGFLVFKLLLVSAVVEPDTLDLLILLSWYTVLAFLRSLAHLASRTTNHTSQSGLPPRAGVGRLLVVVFVGNVTAAACCVALFHGAGWGMVALLTCDCVGLATDVLIHGCRHVVQVLEEREIGETAALGQVAAGGDGNSRKMAVLEGLVFGLELTGCVVTIAHFLHIWYLHGFTCGLVDGVLALHLHTAISSASKKIAERRNLCKIARDLDSLFSTATDLERQKAHLNGDVCCICLTSMSSGNVKKVGCGHLYHATCLREVVERARSIEAAKCPLCRASVLDGRAATERDLGGGGGVGGGPGPGAGGINNNNNNNPLVGEREGREQALFRFSTEGILPSWLPLPAFSFEIVRRPNVEREQQQQQQQPAAIAANNPPPPGGEQRGQQQQQQQQQQAREEVGFWRRLLLMAGAIPMSPEEEARALDQLVDMFPQYDRALLLRELRERGSAEGVVDGILVGGLRLGTEAERQEQEPGGGD